MAQPIRIIETTKGEILTATTSQFQVCLFHEHLSPNIHQQSINSNITLETVRFHVKNPLSLQNTSVTPGLMQNQLQRLMQLQGINASSIIILDNSNYESRVSQLYDKFTVVKGYSYRIEGTTLSLQQRSALMSQDHIYKQLEYEFRYGNGKFKPGFIGQLQLNICLDTHQYHNAFKAYLQYSFQTSCPIIVNTCQLAHFPVFFQTPKQKEQPLAYLKYEQIIQNVENILITAKMYKVNKLIVYNMPFLFVRKFNSQNWTQQLSNLMHKHLFRLLDTYDFVLGFDLSKYSRYSEAMHYIGQLILKYPNRIILSSGLKYKTDLSNFGGEGLLAYSQFNQSNILLKQVIDDQLLLRVFLKNKLELLNWKIRYEEVKIILTWKCSQCGGQQPQTTESFRKFGKQFCSIKCLKGHKF